ncbi:MAG: MgtC/SapB family protein [Acutalibacteraceae bacterium]|nr:MgtC/SapB family protein [Clostridia bacterium]MBQ1707088.1 MgtC/SapB family protein [Clostridia bacterium]MBQ5580410.1 MgtC/SapB family protein [Clostridia bacterium]MEE3373979.1 MgtC/SapB family protein [Acutalibacteraceae bacterium]NLD29025.1 MgtC/SapB family protein [Clostridiales bacterium]
MLIQLDYLRDLNTASVFIRLILALILGGLIGLDRALRHRPAGPRTYALVCVGAALTMVLSQYEYVMLTTDWAPMAEAVGLKTDVSRFGAQVINGIGFLGAGTVIATNQQKVKGLTTASGLWASACLGLVVGSGFYEAAIFAFLLILVTMWLLRPLEEVIIERSRNINIYVEFRSIADMGEILKTIKDQDINIFDMDIHHGREQIVQKPNAVLYLRMPHRAPHHELITLLSDLDEVYTVKEI